MYIDVLLVLTFGFVSPKVVFDCTGSYSETKNLQLIEGIEEEYKSIGDTTKLYVNNVRKSTDSLKFKYIKSQKHYIVVMFRYRYEVRDKINVTFFLKDETGGRTAYKYQLPGGYSWNDNVTWTVTETAHTTFTVLRLSEETVPSTTTPTLPSETTDSSDRIKPLTTLITIDITISEPPTFTVLKNFSPNLRQITIKVDNVEELEKSQIKCFSNSMVLNSDDIFRVTTLPRNKISISVQCLDYSILGYFQCALRKGEQWYFSPPVNITFSQERENYDTRDSVCLPDRMGLAEVEASVFGDHVVVNVTWGCGDNKTDLFEVVIRDLKSCTAGPLKVTTSACHVQASLRRGVLYHVWVMEATGEYEFKPVGMATRVFMPSIQVNSANVSCAKNQECELFLDVNKSRDIGNYYEVNIANYTMIKVTDFTTINFTKPSDDVDPLALVIAECGDGWCYHVYKNNEVQVYIRDKSSPKMVSYLLGALAVVSAMVTVSALLGIYHGRCYHRKTDVIPNFYGDVHETCKDYDLDIEITHRS